MLLRTARLVACCFCLLSAAALASDWAVRVEGGAGVSDADADAMAEEMGLVNAGEAIPGSGIFHFRLPRRARARRDASVLSARATEALSAHPSVAEVEHQSTPLVRVRRVPVPVPFPVPQSPPPPPSSSPAELCFLNTEATAEREALRCVFPFRYKGRTYLECTADHSVNGKQWCATEVRPDGEVVNGQWGDCDFQSLSCFVLKNSGGSREPPQPPARAPPPSRLPPQSRRPLPRPRPRPRPRPPPTSSRLPPPFFPDQAPPLQSTRFNQRPRIPPQFAQRPPPPPPSNEGRFDPRFPPPPPPRGGRPPLPHPPPRGGSGGGFPPRRPPTQTGGQRLPFPFSGGGGGGGGGLNLVENDIEKPIDRRSFKTYLTDKDWPKMWFLNRGKPGMDMNVEDAWAQGYTGKGVSVTILDDGIEYTHDDLKENYDPDASVDINDDDKDPFPRYDFINSNKHGTRCAGTVAASANNSFCGVGIAYNAGIGGVRILDGQILDILEARALSFNRQHVDIYSASWGPDDNGRTVDGPGRMARHAIRDGIAKGRGGKGSIFVWASGNGGKSVDNCNCDGYATSIYTLSVSSSSENGLIPWYSESCSSSLATTYSSGSKRLRERKVVTTDLHGKCTDQHTGTSASSPMAAAIVALALEANPELNWRDVQHLTVRTARPEGNLKARDWSENGVGLKYSHAYGFGLMDAGEMTRMAKDWKAVPEQKKCTTEENLLEEPVVIAPGKEEAVPVKADLCKDIKHIEHLQLHVDLKTTTKRGKLTVMVRSPARTVSVLLAPRPKDDIRTGLGLFKRWPMMSVHFWGEPVASVEVSSTSFDEDATWYLLIRNGGDRPAVLHDFQLTFYGTESDPQPGVPIKLERKEGGSAKPGAAEEEAGVIELDEGVFGAERIEDGWQLEEGLVLLGVDDGDEESAGHGDGEIVVLEEPVLPADEHEEESVEARVDVDDDDDDGLVILDVDPADFGVLPPVLNSDVAIVKEATGTEKEEEEKAEVKKQGTKEARKEALEED